MDGQDVGECGSTLCPSSVCQNGGSCMPGAASWSCRCAPGFIGEVCERRICERSQCIEGMCIAAQNYSPLCLCPRGRQGLLCQQQITVRRSEYSGSVLGYSSYSAYNLGLDPTFSIAVRLHFTTSSLSQVGLLLYLGSHVRDAAKDFMALSIVRGHLMLTWDLGAGPRRLITSVPLDESWHVHSVMVGRRGKRAWLLADTQRNVSGVAPGYLASLDTNNLLYVGGHLSWNMTGLPADMWRHEGFRGCVFDVRVANDASGPWTVPKLSDSVNVKECGEDVCWTHNCRNGGSCISLGATYRCECDIGWRGVSCEVANHQCPANSDIQCNIGSSCITSPTGTSACICPAGKTGLTCHLGINITDPYFTGSNSFLSVRAGNIRREARVSMSFKPASLNGLLFLAIPKESPGDFMALALIDGVLKFTYQLGWHSPGLMVLRSMQKADVNEWQTVTFSRSGADGVLIFGGHTVTASAPDHKTTLLDVQGEVFFGGAPEAIQIPVAAAPEESRLPYTGCIGQVIINGNELDLRIPGGEVLRGSGIEDCDGTACGHNVCLHGGTCIPAGDHFVCQCMPSHTGSRCQIANACLEHECNFGGSCVPLGNAAKKRRQVLTNSQGSSYLCLCPPGRVGDFCEKIGKETAVQFSGRSYVVVPPGPYGSPAKNIDAFALNFTTSAPHGLLLWRGRVTFHLRPEDPGGDYLGVGVWRGRVRVVWQLGGGNIGEVTPTGVVNNGRWHSLVLARTGNIMTVYLDGIPYKRRGPGTFTQINAKSQLTYVGGFPNEITVASGTDGNFQGNFVGCLKDLTLHRSSSPVNFSHLSDGRDLQPCF
ncbi:unnamed protein product, partial [Meganyctiphanes norvegica]